MGYRGNDGARWNCEWLTAESQAMPCMSLSALAVGRPAVQRGFPAACSLQRGLRSWESVWLTAETRPPKTRLLGAAATVDLRAGALKAIAGQRLRASQRRQETRVGWIIPLFCAIRVLLCTTPFSVQTVPRSDRPIPHCVVNRLAQYRVDWEAAVRAGLRSGDRAMPKRRLAGVLVIPLALRLCPNPMLHQVLPAGSCEHSSG